MNYLGRINFRTLIVVATLFTVALSVVPDVARANPKYASLVIDAETGVVLHQENAGKYRHPASLVKMMTLYLTFQAIDKGKLKMHQKVKVSSRAASQSPSKLGLRRGQRIKIQDAILAVVVKSANDAAVVLAEAVAGSEWQFAIMMNRMAKRLGMNHSNFRNASGLHDRRQKTTAYDMARLAVALRRDHRKFYHLFDRTKFYYRGRVYRSHNRVAKTYRGADGLKTGYIRAAGFNLVTSARRGGRSIVGVVMGGKTSKRRDRHMVKLLDRAFYKIARGKVGSERLYTGMVPKPVLKPVEFAKAQWPIPKLKPLKSRVIRAGNRFKNSSYKSKNYKTASFDYRAPRPKLRGVR